MQRAIYVEQCKHSGRHVAGQRPGQRLIYQDICSGISCWDTPISFHIVLPKVGLLPTRNSQSIWLGIIDMLNIRIYAFLLRHIKLNKKNTLSRSNLLIRNQSIQPVTQSANQSVNRSVSELVNQWVSQSMHVCQYSFNRKERRYKRTLLQLVYIFKHKR